MDNELALVDHAAAYRALPARIAMQRERLDLRLRSKYRDPASGSALPGESPRSHTVRFALQHPVLLGVAAGLLFAIGPQRISAALMRAAAIWKLTALLRH